MKDVEVVRYQQRLEHLFKQVKSIDDIEMQAHFARYLCVLVGGFLETSVRRLYGQYARRCSNGNVSNYVDAELKWFQNPSMGKILDLTKSFSAEWEVNLRDASEGELKDAVDSIMANRHNIAHGVSVGISYVSVKAYYERAVKVIELVEAQCE